MRGLPSLAAGVGVACAVIVNGAHAQSADNYPTQPIRFIVPYSAGGNTDIIARLIGEPLAETWKQPVVVDNRPGASGMIGAEAVAKAPADGYTLLYATLSTLTLAPLMQSKMRYDPQKDFVPVTLIATFGYGLITHPSLPAKSLQQLVSLAKANAGKITVASSGLGTGTHLGFEYLASVAGIKFTHVPYKSDIQAVPALLGGEVAMGMFPMTAMLPYLRAKRLRAVVVTSSSRIKELPDVPTVAESGYPGFEAVTWHGVSVRSGTPPGIVRKLNGEIVRILKSKEFSARLDDPTALIVADTPEEFGQFILSENAKWKGVIASAGIHID